MSGLLASGLTLVAALTGSYLIAPQEGYVSKSYVDPVGIITSCYGHTNANLKLGESYTYKECLNTFGKDVSKSEEVVNSVILVPLTFYQKAALISFEYNVGMTAFAKSTLVKYFNNKQYTLGCDQLSRWVYAKGKKLRGLVKRRNKEKQICLGDLNELVGN